MTNNREEQVYKAADKATYQTPPQYSELVHKSRKAMCAYEVGFIDGCVWADQHPHWIPAEERKPLIAYHDDLSENYLVVDSDGELLIAYYDAKNELWFSVDSNPKIYDVTHWMPLPVPPRKEE